VSKASHNIVQYREQMKGQEKEEGKPIEIEGIKE